MGRSFAGADGDPAGRHTQVSAERCTGGLLGRDVIIGRPTGAKGETSVSTNNGGYPRCSC